MFKSASKKPQISDGNTYTPVALPREWPCRLGGSLLVLLSIFLLAFLTYVANSDWLVRRIEDLRRGFYSRTSAWGFTVDDVIVIGRNKTSLSDIREMTNIRRGDNILAVDLEFLRNNLEALPWVKEVTLRRSFFPNVIQINLQEREVRALWQLDNRFHPIDADGKVIEAPFTPREPILLIVGEEAPQNIKPLLESISGNQDILRRIKVASFISKRRWNLTLDDIENGITIKLPEENIDAAWKKLLKLNTTNGILKRKLTIIDLRLEGKVIVKLKKSHSGLNRRPERKT